MATIGKIYGVGGGANTVTITFKVTPETATVVLRDRNNETVNPVSDKIYKIAPRNILL